MKKEEVINIHLEAIIGIKLDEGEISEMLWLQDAEQHEMDLEGIELNPTSLEYHMFQIRGLLK